MASDSAYLGYVHLDVHTGPPTTQSSLQVFLIEKENGTQEEKSYNLHDMSDHRRLKKDLADSERNRQIRLLDEAKDAQDYGVSKTAQVTMSSFRTAKAQRIQKEQKGHLPSTPDPKDEKDRKKKRRVKKERAMREHTKQTPARYTATVSSDQDDNDEQLAWEEEMERYGSYGSYGYDLSPYSYDSPYENSMSWAW